MVIALKKISLLIVVNALLCFALNSANAKGSHDSAGFLELFGKVKSANTIPQNALIIVYQNGVKQKQYRVADNGRFDIKLALNAVYELQFTGYMMISKTVQVSTLIPDPENLYCEYEYKFNVNLIGGYNGMEGDEHLRQPSVKIIYNKVYDGFDYDRDYNREVKNQRILSLY